MKAGKTSGGSPVTTPFLKMTLTHGEVKSCLTDDNYKNRENMSRGTRWVREESGAESREFHREKCTLIRHKTTSPQHRARTIIWTTQNTGCSGPEYEHLYLTHTRNRNSIPHKTRAVTHTLNKEAHQAHTTGHR